MGHREAVLPVDRVGIKNQLSFDGLRVIENEHAVAAYDDEFLFLEGVEPAHEDMGANARWELEIRHGDIGNAGMKEFTADRIDIAGVFACQAENDRNIVGGKRPKDIFLPANLA